MKYLIAVILLGLVSPILGGEEAIFETAKKPKIGESGAFKLSKSNRAILKIGENGYLVLDLLESSREDGGKTFTEACSISWTLITPQFHQDRDNKCLFTLQVGRDQKELIHRHNDWWIGYN